MCPAGTLIPSARPPPFILIVFIILESDAKICGLSVV